MSSSTRQHQAKDHTVEAALEVFNDRLAGVLEDDAAQVERPLALLVGHQRSGSTLVSQYLCASLDVGYPSNVIARFWRAPVAGISIEKSLSHQLGPVRSTFQSELGTTHALRDPHEFSYFWNEWFPGETRCRDEAAFYRTVANMERAFGRPLLFKNNFNSLRIELLARLLPTSIFVVIRRDLLDVACSTLNARRSRYGDDTAWFGIRPPACEDVSQLSPYEQIAAQVHHTEAAITTGLASLAPDRVIEISYEAFCAEPGRLRDQLVSAGFALRPEADLPSSFRGTSTAVGHPDADALARALADA
ncbi:MAG TPA: sulfotransferase [Kofleriaceae bacterium]|nr:sulfotransferase [Kofleriaceae bacterium]